MIPHIVSIIFPTEILPFKKSFLEPKAENVGIAHLFNAMSILELIIFMVGFLVCCLWGFLGWLVFLGFFSRTLPLKLFSEHHMDFSLKHLC